MDTAPSIQQAGQGMTQSVSPHTAKAERNSIKTFCERWMVTLEKLLAMAAIYFYD